MPQHDVIVVGASAGGLQALTAIVERLPATLEACVLVVMHTRAESNGVLPDILRRFTAIPVQFATHADQLQRGIYVAPPDVHLIVTRDGLSLVHGPRENGFRPAIDPLFRTAARTLGSRVIGVILSGALSDGTYGLSVIKQHGGLAIVQDPGDAVISSMPKNAIDAVEVDHVLPADAIAGILERLTREDAPGGLTMARSKDLEPQLPSENTQVSAMQERYGAPSSLTCPDCGGALWEVQEGRVVRYQCHVGHQYGPDSLEAEHCEAVDGALWTAVRVLEEHAELKMRMARRASAGGLTVVGRGFEDGARDAHRQAQEIRAVLFSAAGGAAKAAAADSSRAPKPLHTRGTRAASAGSRQSKGSRKKTRR